MDARRYIQALLADPIPMEPVNNGALFAILAKRYNRLSVPICPNGVLEQLHFRWRDLVRVVIICLDLFGANPYHKVDWLMSQGRHAVDHSAHSVDFINSSVLIYL